MKSPLAVVAAAVVGTTAMLPLQAQAAIVYNPATINIPTSLSGVYLNLVTGANSTSPAGASGWDFNPWGSGSFFAWANNAASPNDGVVCGLGSSVTLSDNLALGTTVGAGQTYCRTPSIETTGSTAHILNSINYVGVRFLNEATGQLNFGWVGVQLSGAFNGQPRSIVGWAYENTGGSINVGQVPEPGTIALLALALGAASAAGRRGKRNAAAS